MSLSLLDSLLTTLPYGLREPIGGYARSVQAVAPEIIRKAGVAVTPRLVDQLVYLAGVRRLWSLIDGQYWMIDNALGTIERDGGEGIRAGASTYVRGGGSLAELRSLQRGLRRLLDGQGALLYVNARSLQEIVALLDENGPGRA